MAKLVWDQTGDRLYETGVSKGVLYPIQSDGAYSKGVAWNGLSSVTESPSGAEANPIYADDMKYLNLLSAEEFVRHLSEELGSVFDGTFLLTLSQNATERQPL